MLVFGPYRAIPKDSNMVVFNLSSPTQAIPRLPGLLVTPSDPITTSGIDDGTFEKSFDMWYYDYVLNDPTACSSLMSILECLYQGCHVFVCISDNSSGGIINMVNEAFMKILQTRYGITYSIVNVPEDFEYISQDGCDFRTVDGIQTFDSDRSQFRQLETEQYLSRGGSINVDD